MNAPLEDKLGINALRYKLSLILTGGLKIFPTMLFIILTFAAVVIIALALIFKNLPLLGLVIIIPILYYTYTLANSMTNKLFGMANRRNTQALFFSGREWQWDRKFASAARDDRKLRPPQNKLIATQPVFSERSAVITGVVVKEKEAKQ